MGFFGSLAKKVSGAVSTLGQKVASGARAGIMVLLTAKRSHKLRVK